MSLVYVRCFSGLIDAFFCFLNVFCANGREEFKVTVCCITVQLKVILDFCQTEPLQLWSARTRSVWVQQEAMCYSSDGIVNLTK